jgi:hypothetical protein
MLNPAAAPAVAVVRRADADDVARDECRILEHRLELIGRAKRHRPDDRRRAGMDFCNRHGKSFARAWRHQQGRADQLVGPAHRTVAGDVELPEILNPAAAATGPPNWLRVTMLPRRLT